MKKRHLIRLGNASRRTKGFGGQTPEGAQAPRLP